MATSNVTKVHCDRCARVEEKPVLDPMTLMNPVAQGGLQQPTVNLPAQVVTLHSPPKPAFEATLLVDDQDGKSKEHQAGHVKFQDLCGPCQRTVQALLYQIGKKIDGLSPDRKEAGAKKKAAPLERAASSSPSPHHSAAAGNAPKESRIGTRS